MYIAVYFYEGIYIKNCEGLHCHGFLIPNSSCADDKCMKKALFFPVLAVIVLFSVTGCTSAPVTPAPSRTASPPQQTAPAPATSSAQAPAPVPVSGRNVDIWSLLRSGDDRAMSYFLGEVDVNITDSQGRTPLHYAAENQDARLAAFLVSLGANTNVLDHARISPLLISVEKNDTETAGIIANAKANIHLLVKSSTTAASIALAGNPSVFKALLTGDSVQTVDSNGKTVLHLASVSGSIQGVNDVLSVSPSGAAYVNKRDNAGKNALDYALERTDSRDHMAIAERLILSGGSSQNPVFAYFAPAARGANYNIRRSEGLAPIHYAVINNYTGLIAFLLEKNIDVNIKSASGATALHEAARTGNTQLITLLLNNGADVNSVDAKGNTPLHLGVPSDVHREVISLLLSKGANPNLRDEHGDTPLHIAIILNRSLNVIQAMLGGGSDVYIRNIEGKTPLYVAVHERRVPVIPVLLSYGSEVFAADNAGITPFDLAFRANNGVFTQLVTPETVSQRDSAGNTLLHAAVRNRGSTDQITRILSHGAPVDARNRAGDTALHIAVRTNQKETGELLISKGAGIFSVNAAEKSPLYLALSDAGGIRQWIINPFTIIARDGLGNNMLHYAAQWNLNNAIPLIVRNGLGANEPNATGETPLFMAVKTDSPSTIRALLENRANINARDTHGNSALHAAVRWNAVKSAAFLIACGIDVNVFSLNGNTPLHDAVTTGVPDIETLLINNGAAMEVRNDEGNTPFMEAVKAANIPSIERLANNKADTSARNISGDTPLHIAVSMEQTDIVIFLLRTGCSIHARNTADRTPFQNSIGVSPQMVSVLLTGSRINTSDDFGNSALHIALQERAPQNILRAIISRGARLNAVDSGGKTPLRLAVDTEQWNAAKLLADAGADPFFAAADGKSPAEISFSKGDECLRALFSGKAIDAKDNLENTVLHFAARYGNPRSISLLLSFGANKSVRNISSEIPYETALRWNRRDNAELLRVNIGY